MLDERLTELAKLGGEDFKIPIKMAGVKLARCTCSGRFVKVAKGTEKLCRTENLLALRYWVLIGDSIADDW